MHEVTSIEEAIQIMRHISDGGRMPLFHGTPHDFDRIEISQENSRGFGNSGIGIHVTSDPFLALDYVGMSEDRGGILILSVAPGRFGSIDSRDVYINIDAEGVTEIVGGLSEPIVGIIADDLGDDLSEAGIVFDPSSLYVAARIPAALAKIDLYEPKDDEARLMDASRQYCGWDGAEICAIDTWDMVDRYRIREPF